MSRMNETKHHSAIRLVTARVSNFRSLREVEIGFDDLMVLIGENNSGKPRLLESKSGTSTSAAGLVPLL